MQAVHDAITGEAIGSFQGRALMKQPCLNIEIENVLALHVGRLYPIHKGSERGCRATIWGLFLTKI
jgi:hypothetical protein